MDATPRTFNSPLEAGLRALFVLSAAGRRALDTQRLVYMDYILIHSGDLGGPESLHADTPSRKGELLVRRELLTDGLVLMRSRDLVERKFRASGIAWLATREGRHVVEQFESRYASTLKTTAKWAVETFGSRSDQALAQLLGAEWQDELIHASTPGELGDGESAA